jgi:hypothetical protein
MEGFTRRGDQRVPPTCRARSEMGDNTQYNHPNHNNNSIAAALQQHGVIAIGRLAATTARALRRPAAPRNSRVRRRARATAVPTGAGSGAGAAREATTTDNINWHGCFGDGPFFGSGRDGGWRPSWWRVDATTASRAHDDTSEAAHARFHPIDRGH